MQAELLPSRAASRAREPLRWLPATLEALEGPSLVLGIEWSSNMIARISSLFRDFRLHGITLHVYIIY